MITGKTVGGALLTLVALFLVFLFFRGCETETRSPEIEASSQLQEELEALRQEREANQRELEALRKEQELLRRQTGQPECMGYRASPPPLMPTSPQEPLSERVPAIQKAFELMDEQGAVIIVGKENTRTHLEGERDANRIQQEFLKERAETELKRKQLLEIAELKHKIKMQEKKCETCIRVARETSNDYVQRQAEGDLLQEQAKLEQLRIELTSLVD
jgi:hypothetical protein